MTLLHALLLGIIQGLTEFIPVSSTAHVLILGEILGIPADGKVFSFSIIVQLGTVVAMLVFFWKDIWHIIRAFFLGIKHRKPFETLDARMGWLIIVASIPALAAGFLLRDVVKTMFTDPFTQAGARLLVTALLLSAVEYFDKRTRTLESATWLDALTVGLFQVLAIFPGASRSGTTIAGGMARGFDRPSAARFAFLMSSPVLVAAGLYESLHVAIGPDTQNFLPYLFIGFLSAAVVGWFAIKWLIDYLSKRSLYGFAIYCAVVGISLLLIQWI
jgi:undecaprenyl-diphosphatase